MGIAFVLWLTSVLVIFTDVRDADGFTDCGDTCNGVQTAVSVAFWYSPFVFALALLIFLTTLVAARLRRR